MINSKVRGIEFGLKTKKWTTNGKNLGNINRAQVALKAYQVVEDWSNYRILTNNRDIKCQS